VKPRAATAGSEPVAPPARRPYDAFDLLASMVAVVEPDGACRFVNAAFEQVFGLSRRSVTRGKRRYRLALELRIRDNGPGVPQAIREHIFYPLVSGRDGGSGLGLTLAQTFVQQHHGTIECESVPGNTVFKIEIPLP
jgi:nitrogen-specific signal transduction histidine kinase